MHIVHAPSHRNWNDLRYVCHISPIKVSARVQSANFRNLWFRDFQIKLSNSFLLKKKKSTNKCYFSAKLLDGEVYYTLIVSITRWQVLSFWSNLYVNTSRSKSHSIVLSFYHAIEWFKCLRKKKKGRGRVRFRLQRQGGRNRKNRLARGLGWKISGEWQGLLLRPGAMADGVERTAKRRIRPVGFHINKPIKNYGWRTSCRSGKRKYWNMGKVPWPRHRNRWKIAGEDQRNGDLSLLSRKRWTCGKFRK